MNTASHSSSPGLPLRGIVARVRHNTPESGRALVESEYVAQEAQGVLALTAEPEVEWTTERWRAREMPWIEEEKLAASIGFPSHAIVVASRKPVGVVMHSAPVSRPLTGADAYARYEHEREQHE